MVVGDDVAGFVPDEAGAGADGLTAQAAAAHIADHQHHGRRGRLEDRDRCLLAFRERAARLDDPRVEIAALNVLARATRGDA
jgi:hypothetical protein